MTSDARGTPDVPSRHRRHRRLRRRPRRGGLRRAPSPRASTASSAGPVDSTWSPRRAARLRRARSAATLSAPWRPRRSIAGVDAEIHAVPDISRRARCSARPRPPRRPGRRRILPIVGKVGRGSWATSHERAPRCAVPGRRRPAPLPRHPRSRRDRRRGRRRLVRGAVGAVLRRAAARCLGELVPRSVGSISVFAAAARCTGTKTGATSAPKAEADLRAGLTVRGEAEVRVVIGDAGAMLATASEAADLVVVGPRGWARSKRVALGSTSDHPSMMPPAPSWSRRAAVEGWTPRSPSPRRPRRSG